MRNIRLVFIMLMLVILIAGCQPEPIRIGFIGDLSSKNAQLGIDARNAVELYVEWINEQGGVDGHPVQLVIKDDGGDTAQAQQMHAAFLEEDVELVIGHMTSAFADAMIESACDRLLFISPSMGTDQLAGRDDYILRCASSNRLQGDMFHQYVKEQGYQCVAVVYDRQNAAYTESMFERIDELNLESKSYHLQGYAFDSKGDDVIEIASELMTHQPDAVLMIMQAMDSALLLQNVKQYDPNVDVFSVSWSMTRDFIENSGQAGEGTLFIGTYISSQSSEEKMQFVNRYTERFQNEPTFISGYTYDAVKVLLYGVASAQSSDPLSVKQAIIDQGEFQGIETRFTIDAYGDADKPYMMYILEDGEFVPLRGGE